MGLRRVLIEAKYLLAVLHDGLHPAYKIVKNAVPQDAKVGGVRYNNGTLDMIVDSKQWPDLFGPNNEIMIHPPVEMCVADTTIDPSIDMEDSEDG